MTYTVESHFSHFFLTSANEDQLSFLWMRPQKPFWSSRLKAKVRITWGWGGFWHRSNHQGGAAGHWEYTNMLLSVIFGQTFLLCKKQSKILIEQTRIYGCFLLFTHFILLFRTDLHAKVCCSGILKKKKKGDIFFFFTSGHNVLTFYAHMRSL